MEYNEEDYLMLSGIQHFVFCRRQWAMIHIENQWEENLRTVEGDIMHKRAHEGPVLESRGDTLFSREMHVKSKELGITGICDVIEFNSVDCESVDTVRLQNKKGFYTITPIEYKKGKPKITDADRLQLIAQVICLEEMFCTKIDVGYMFYGETKHREKIIATEEMRSMVREIVKEMHKLFDSKVTPKVKPSKSCNACSLKDICLPKLMNIKTVRQYMDDAIKDD